MSVSKLGYPKWYQKRTPEQFKASLNKRGRANIDGYLKPEFKRYKMKDGKNLVRVLPASWEDADDFAYEIWVNYNVGPDNLRFLNLAQMGRGKDPLAGSKLIPSRRFVAWIIDRMAEEDGPQLLDFPGKLRTPICTKSQDEDRGIIYIDDPVEGADVRFYVENAGKKEALYPGEQVTVLKQSSLSDDGALAAEWLDYVKAHPVPDCLQYFEFDYISEVFNGAAKSAEDEEPEAPPAKTNSHKDEGSARDEPEEGLSLKERLRRRRQQVEEEA